MGEEREVPANTRRLLHNGVEVRNDDRFVESAAGAKGTKAMTKEAGMNEEDAEEIQSSR